MGDPEWRSAAIGTEPDRESPGNGGSAPHGGTGCYFTVAFSDDQGAAPVTYDPPSDTGLRAQDLAVSGTAFGGEPQASASPEAHRPTRLQSAA